MQVPSVSEGAAALAAGAAAVEPQALPGTPGQPTATVSAPGLGHVPSPYGDLHLAPAAADAWNAMRTNALSVHGIDIYPGGPLAAYRTHEHRPSSTRPSCPATERPRTRPARRRTSSGPP